MGIQVSLSASHKTTLKWILGRSLRSIGLLVGASFIVYATLRSTPGDMVSLIGMNLDESMKASLRREFGLDMGIILGYIQWMFQALQGNLGKSTTFQPGASVAELAIPAFLVTLSLALLTLIIGMTLAFILTALLGKPHPKQSLFLGPLSFTTSIPSFVLSALLAKGINHLIQWQLSSGGQIPPIWYPLPQYTSIGESVAPFAFALLAITFGDGLFIDLLNALRAEVNQLSSAQFINAIRAKGANPRNHLIKNLIVPTLSIFTARLPLVLSAVIIVEYTFSLDGSGYVLFESAKRRDLPMVVGVSLCFITAVILMNLILDVVKAQIDPREVAHEG